jgi:hypothetical protein
LPNGFVQARGVVTIGPSMPDAVILSTIKLAVSYGKPFTVIPPMTILLDEMN